MSPVVHALPAIPRELYPFQGRHIDVNGHRVHVLDEGRGPAVLMVHGNPTWSFYWRRLVLALRDDHRVIAPDHVGCGLSDKPPPEAYPYTLRRRVDDLEAMVEALAPEGPLTLVLHDWGGMIGMAWAARHPERVGRLVLLNTAAFPLPPEKPLPFTLRLVRDTALGAWLVTRLNAFARGAVHLAVTRRLPRDVARAYLAPYDSPANRVATLRFVQDIPLGPGDPGYEIVAETEAALARFRDTPTLICWGERDFVFDEAFLRGWRERLPGAEVHRFPRAGHYVLEDAHELIVPLVREWLADTAPRPPGSGA